MKQLVLLISILFCFACASQSDVKTLEGQMVIPEVAPEYTINISPGMFYEKVPPICIDSYEIKGPLTCMTRNGQESCIQSDWVQVINNYVPNTLCLDAAIRDKEDD